MIGTPTLDILSAGAAKAVVLALAATVRDREGLELAGVFDAAGAIRARFVAGDPCDVLILPATMLDELVAGERVDAAVALGDVPTGIAVAAGAPAPQVHDADALCAAFDGASALFCPDTERSTAGIHFVTMLRAMGLHGRVADRIRAYANGAQAMAALAATTSGRDRAIGCTQVTEILYTPGVTLVAPLPQPYELTTTYSAACSRAARNPAAGRRFVAWLTGSESRDLRAASGFASN